jgi:hypothetical protein
VENKESKQKISNDDRHWTQASTHQSNSVDRTE